MNTIKNKPKTLDEVKQILLLKKEYLKKKYNIKEIGIFGSYAYGNPKEKSDLDILVEFENPIGLDFVSLADELEGLLEHKIDLVSANAIKPNMMKSVMENLIYV